MYRRATKLDIGANDKQNKRRQWTSFRNISVRGHDHLFKQKSITIKVARTDKKS